MIRQEELSVSDLVAAKRNPNFMAPDRYKRLVRFIDKIGFVQPILVHEVDGSYVIVDGHHRVRAAKELGLETVPAVLVDAEDQFGEAMAIAMNGLRGDMDLGIASDIVLELREDGIAFEEIVTYTGMSDDEAKDLIKLAEEAAKSIEEVAPCDVDGVVDDAPSDKGEPEDKTWTLKVIFDDEEDFKNSRTALRQRAGAAGGLADGLLSLLDEVE